MQERSLRTFKNGDTICFHHEKVYHAMKHCSYIALTCVKYIYIRKKLSKNFIFQNQPFCSNIKNETRAKIVCELYEIVSRKVKLCRV